MGMDGCTVANLRWNVNDLKLKLYVENKVGMK